MHVDTDPNRHGMGQIPDATSTSPANQGAQPYPGAQNAPANNNSQAGITYDELAAKKGFKSHDDLANAYDHLERKLGERSPSPLPSPQPSGQPNQTTTAPSKTSESERLQRLEQRAEIEDLKIKYNDIPQFSQAILDKVRANPGIPLEDAYKAVKFDAAQEAARDEGYTQGKEEGSTLAEQKMRAATTLPNARNEMPAPSLEQRIKGVKTKADLKAVEEMLPHA